MIRQIVREQCDKVFAGHVPGDLSKDVLVGLMRVTIDVLDCYKRSQPIQSAHFFRVHRMASAYNVIDNESKLSCCVLALATMMMEFSGSLIIPHTALAQMGMVPSTSMMSLPQLAPMVPPKLVVPSVPMQPIYSTMAVTQQGYDSRSEPPSDVNGEVGGPSDVKKKRIESTAAAAPTEQQQLQPGSSAAARIYDANDDTILDVVGRGVLDDDNNVPHSPVVPPHGQLLTTPLAEQTVAATLALQPMQHPVTSATAKTGGANTADTNGDAARKAARAAAVAASVAMYSPLLAPTLLQQLQHCSRAAPTIRDANDDTTSNVSGVQNSVTQPVAPPHDQVLATPLTEQADPSDIASLDGHSPFPTVDSCPKAIKQEPMDDFDHPGTSSPVRRPPAAILTSSSFGKEAAHRRMNDEQYRAFVERQLAINQRTKEHLEKSRVIKEEERDEEEEEKEEKDQCELCGEESLGGLPRHNESYHRKNRECDKCFCDFFSLDVQEREEHKKVRGRACCPHCHLPLKNLSEYVVHLKKEHVEEMTSEEQIHVCDECGTETKRIHEMLEHWEQKNCPGTLLLSCNAVALMTRRSMQ